MPRLLVTIDGVVIKEVPLVNECTRVGRRPYNDVVIDHLAVSGEHAVFVTSPDGSVAIEDLGSTNGTYVNGQRVLARHELHGGDTVEVGKYKLRVLVDEEAPQFERTMIVKPGMLPPAMAPRPAPPPAAPLAASVRITSGPAAGREMALTKVVTTLGKPGVAVASITRRHHGFVLAHVEGADLPVLNGTSLKGGQTMPLKHGDRIALAGTEMEFVQG